MRYRIVVAAHARRVPACRLARQKWIMTLFERIVVPCEGIPDAVTLSVARVVAAELRATMCLYSIASAGLVKRDESELRQIAERVGPGVDVIVEVDDGRTVADRLVEFAGRAGVLLCLRTHAKAAIVEAVAGGIGTRVLRSSKVDVLAIGPRCQPVCRGPGWSSASMRMRRLRALSRRARSALRSD